MRRVGVWYWRPAAGAWSLAQRCEGARNPALAELRAPGPTRSEQEVAHLAATGLTSREIADRLVRSVRTVDSHLGNVYSKFGVDNRHDLADLLKVRWSFAARIGPTHRR